MLWQYAYRLSLLLMLLGFGCASVRPSAAIPKPSFLQSKKKTEPASSRSSSKETESSSPKRQPLIAQKEKPAEEEAPTIQKHDPATRFLIESELRDASPAEREEWMAYLATIDSQRVPFALKSRRITQQDGSTETGLDKASEADESPILQAGHSLGANDQHRIMSDESSQKSDLALASAVTPAVASASPAGNSESHNHRRDWPEKIKSVTDWDKNLLGLGRAEPKVESHSNSTNALVPKNIPRLLTNPLKEDAPGVDIESEINSADQTALLSDLSSGESGAADEAFRIKPGTQIWEDELQKLISLMEAEASATGRNGTGTLTRDQLRQQVALRMLYLVNDQQQLAQQPIPGLQPADQEFWTSLFWGLSDYMNDDTIDPTERATRTIAQLRSAVVHLQMASRLKIRNATFCQQINSFGSYEQFPSDEFTPGEEVLIYSEIRNFNSEPTSDGFYVTRLRSTLEVYQGGVDGNMIDRRSFDATVDQCRTLRSDYFHAYRYEIPADLSAGPYVLKIVVQDESTGKIAIENLNFSVR